jgi:hypothetical protein
MTLQRSCANVTQAASINVTHTHHRTLHICEAAAANASMMHHGSGDGELSHDYISVWFRMIRRYLQGTMGF